MVSGKTGLLNLSQQGTGRSNASAWPMPLAPPVMNTRFCGCLFDKFSIISLAVIMGKYLGLEQILRREKVRQPHV
jgi:hypothetical protein